MIRRLLPTKWCNGKPIVQPKTRLDLPTISALPDPEEIKLIRAEELKLQREKRKQKKEDTDRWVAGGSIPSQKPPPRKNTGIQSYMTAVAAASVAHVVRWWNRKEETGNAVEFTKAHADF